MYWSLRTDNVHPWNTTLLPHHQPIRDLLRQFNSVAQSCPTLWDPMDCSTPGLPVHHQLPTHFHWVGDAIQWSHPLSSPSPHTFSLCQHQGLFKWVSSSHQVAKVLEFQLPVWTQSLCHFHSNLKLLDFQAESHYYSSLIPWDINSTVHLFCVRH